MENKTENLQKQIIVIERSNEILKSLTEVLRITKEADMSAVHKCDVLINLTKAMNSLEMLTSIAA